MIELPHKIEAQGGAHDAFASTHVGKHAYSKPVCTNSGNLHFASRKNCEALGGIQGAWFRWSVTHSNWLSRHDSVAYYRRWLANSGYIKHALECCKIVHQCQTSCGLIRVAEHYAQPLGGLPAAPDSEEIMDTQKLIATLEAAPGIIIGLVREVPPQNLKRRPAPNKWSAHEHACHISTGHAVFLSRLELMLSDPHPQIKSMEPSPDEEAGSLLNVDLDEALGRYVRERALVVKRLKELSAEDWQRTAEHEAFSHYSVYIMFRHMLMHEMLHAYRIDELMLKKDWE